MLAVGAAELAGSAWSQAPSDTEVEAASNGSVSGAVDRAMSDAAATASEAARDRAFAGLPFAPFTALPLR